MSQLLPVTSRNKTAPILDQGRQQVLGLNDLAIDAWGRQKTVLDYSVMHAMATFNISPKVWFVDEDGVEIASSLLATRATASNGGFNITSGASIGNSCTLRGQRHPRYQPNRGWLFSTAGVLPNKDAFGRRVFGGITEESGLFFELLSGVLSAVVRVSEWEYYTATAGQTTFMYSSPQLLGTSTVYCRYKATSSVEWLPITGFTRSSNNITLSNGLQAGDTLIIIVVNDDKIDITGTIRDLGIDLEKENLFDIQNQWRGAGDTFFYINNSLVCTNKNLGIGTVPNISNPALPIYFKSENLGDEVSMLMGCADITSEGGDVDKLEYTAIVNKPQIQIPVTSITLPPKVLVVAYSPDTCMGRHNTRDFHILRVTASTDANAFLSVYTSRNPIWVTDSLVLKDRDDGSAILYDNALNSTDSGVRNLSFDTTSGRLITTVRIPANTSSSIDNPNMYKVDYTITHGDYLIVVGYYEKTGTANMLAVVELGEEL